ncbi:hypothetical protein EPR50_G00135550 [Perca flavescens]|uniref:Uncharacterized protein n=1 Tax=Perca flavescens TaxID=8167 RepID=A0A484CTF1_PERFV|nr:hypothetical protein EPR50_G00135550 [Perca flavescens]
MHSLLGREKKEEEAGFGIDLGLSPGFLPQAATMFSCVGCFWVLLSSALVAVCSFSFISPAWIVKDQLRNNQHHHHHHHNNNKDSVSFGLLWHCSESLDHMYRCYTFGGLGKFAEIPSSSWQVGNTHVYPMGDECEHAGHQVGRARHMALKEPGKSR